MPRPSLKQSVQLAVERLVARDEPLSSGAVAREAGVSRQTASTHLEALVRDGTLRRVGQGRSSRYERVAEGHLFRLAGLVEDKALEEIRARSALTPKLGPRASQIFDYVVTEMLNNAIDHSGGTQAWVRLSENAGRLVAEIEDDGEGALAHVRRKRGLGSDLEALQDLSKGKVTTDPERHSGQGIFFSARAVDRFELESGELRWIVENTVDDVAIGQTAVRRGTRIRVFIAFDTSRDLKEVFDQYSGEDFAFSKTRTWIRLFETGLGFVSRSEAKRLCSGLENFEEAVLDFKGVSAVGQGFADEVFRVWARAHPQTRLTPINMVAPVEFMVRRALSEASPR